MLINSEPLAIKPRHILVTGASGALGKEIALRVARAGVCLSLWGRNRDRLASTAALCRAAGAEAAVCVIDINDLTGTLAMLGERDADHPFATAYLVAGQGDTLARGAIVEDPAQVIRLSQTNFVAPAAMAALLADRMAQRGQGRIGIIGTAAASHSLPFAAAYSGSKAGLARFADALRLAVRRHGVSVTLISPGFFAPTGSGAAANARPGEIPAGVVAERAIAAVGRGAAELVLPRRFLLLRWFDRLLPRRLRDRILLGLPRP
jgi:short-subunit dehydrogenase